MMAFVGHLDVRGFRVTVHKGIGTMREVTRCTLYNLRKI